MEIIADGDALPARRRLRWDSVALYVSGVVATLCVVWFAAAVADHSGPIMLSWLIAPVFTAGAAYLARLTAGTGHLPEAARQFWSRLSIALVVLTFSLLSRLGDAVNPDLTLTPRISVQSAVGHAIAAALLIWPVYRLPSRAQTLGQRIGLWLDVGAVSLGIGVFVWQFTMRPLLAEAVALAPVLALGGTLALAGVTAVYVATKVAALGSTPVNRHALLLFGMGMGIGALGPSLRPLLGGGDYLETSIILLVPGAFLVMVGAHLQRTACARTRLRAEPRQRCYSRLPYVAIAGTDVLLLITLPGSSVRDRMVVGVVAVVLTGMVVIRQIAATRQNEQLVERLNTGLLELQNHEERYRCLVQNSYDVVTINQPDGRIDYMSGGSQRMFGRAPSQRTGQNILELVHPDDQAATRRHFDTVLAAPGSSAMIQARLAHADGSWRWIEVLSTNLLHEPSVQGILSNSRDISEARELQDRLGYEATHDVLTGLANRALFNQRVAASVAIADAAHNLSIVLIDLDNFKTVNDMLGHAIGDALLATVAERMCVAVRPADTVARLGGDEFAILLEGIVAADVDRVIERIIVALRQPVYVEGHRLSAQASFGVVGGRSGDDAGDLLRHADIAMYEAKARGEGGWQHYRPGMEARGADQNRLAAELRDAVADGQLRVYYQPVVSLPHGAMTGVEALVRWEHPERGLVAPTDFIPLAEQTGLIGVLGGWVLREACRQASHWLSEYGDRAPQGMSVNVSGRQLQDPTFAEEVMAALIASGLEARRLTLEITESTAVGGGPTDETLRRLRELGVRVALDDFGTGQSTLSLLATCPVDQIKLDRSFAPLPATDVIATAVVHLARVLGLEVVAEGVETAAQADVLHGLGYEHAQGFHFARPMTADAISAALDGATVQNLHETGVA